jgi:hypothetical protein
LVAASGDGEGEGLLVEKDVIEEELLAVGVVARADKGVNADNATSVATTTRLNSCVGVFRVIA